MLGGLGAPELIVIALIALLLFGAGRIADIGKGLGQGIKNFKQGLKEAGDEDKDEKVEKSEKAEKSEKKADKSEKSEKAEKKKDEAEA
jgi:sec-independent protein translocase protein TatA